MSHRKGKRKWPKKPREVCMRHAMGRMRERYGVTMSDSEYEELCKVIQSGRLMPVFRESHTRTHWDIQFKGQVVRAVYLKTVHGIVTVLPKDSKAA